MTGRQVLVSVLVIILATAVLPPAAAWTVNRRRVARAEREVSALALQMGSHTDELKRVAADADVLCGPGEFPAASNAETQRWVSAPRGSLATVIVDAPLTQDPWGNCLVVRLSTPVWVLSAGPNGTIDTAFSATASDGDDLVVPVNRVSNVKQ